MSWLLFSVALAAPPVTGTWTLAEAPDALAHKHAAALELGLSRLPWAMRPLAKGQLTKTIRNCAQVELSVEGGTFRARCGAGKPFGRAFGATAPFTGDDGKPYEITLTESDTAVVLRFSGEQGGQQTTYTQQADGSLLITKEIFSPWLEAPFSWAVRYTR